MKKFFLVICLLCLAGMLYAQDEGTSSSKASSNDSGKGFDWDVHFGISLPFIMNLGGTGGIASGSGIDFPGAAMIMGFGFSSISLGMNFQYTIIPHFLAPGIYADVHFNLFTWFLLGMFTNFDLNFVLLQPQVRFYNQFRVNKDFAVDPFIGLNFVTLTVDYDGSSVVNANYTLLNAGIVLRMGDSFGFEICYNFNCLGGDYTGNPPQILSLAFSWGLRNRD
jgi:hypothetical protein